MSRATFATVAVAVAAFSLAVPAVSQDANDFVVDLGRGPVVVHVPDAYDPAVPTPLVLLLHGYGSTGALQEAYMRFLPVSEERVFLYAYPDGTRDILGAQFWNATNACCDFFNTNVDDSGYLASLIAEIKAQANVDDREVYITGHSNGGYMSYRMACDHSQTVASIASLAGATWSDASRCNPAEPVHILQIHGTADATVQFDGGCFPLIGCYPGVIDDVKQWAGFADCDRVVDTSEPPKDLDILLPGDETLVAKVETGCLPGGSAEAWAIVDGGHVPAFGASYAEQVIDFLFAHPKP